MLFLAKFPTINKLQVHFSRSILLVAYLIICIYWKEEENDKSTHLNFQSTQGIYIYTCCLIPLIHLTHVFHQQLSSDPKQTLSGFGYFTSPGNLDNRFQPQHELYFLPSLHPLFTYLPTPQFMCFHRNNTR